MKDQFLPKDLLSEIQDLRERVRRLEAGWGQVPQAIGYEQASSLTFSNTGTALIATSNCIVTAQYLHHLIAVGTSNYTGGGDITLRLLLNSTVGSAIQVLAASATGPSLQYYQNSIDLFELIGEDVRGKEMTIELEAGVTVAGGFVNLALNGGYTLRANPASRYLQIFG